MEGVVEVATRAEPAVEGVLLDPIDAVAGVLLQSGLEEDPAHRHAEQYHRVRDPRLGVVERDVTFGHLGLERPFRRLPISWNLLYLSW